MASEDRLRIGGMSGLRIYADDLGLSASSDRDILETVENGPVNMVSVLVNGPSFEGLASELPPGRLSLHLNLIEGPSLTPCASLTDNRGKFKRGFLGIWFYYSLPGKKKRQAVRDDIRMEIEAQMKRFVEKTGAVEISIDSHQHVHLFPFVLEELLNIRGDYNITFVRTACEPFYLVLSPFSNIFNYFNLSIIKHLVLKGFSRRAIKRLEAAGIPHNKYCVGILGQMTEETVATAFHEIRALGGNERETTVVFHPGKVLAEDESAGDWMRYGYFYRSSRRSREKALILSNEFEDLVWRDTSPINKLSREISVYVIVGLSSLLINLAALYFFTEVVGIWYLASTALAFFAAFATSFIFNRNYTFRDENDLFFMRQAVLYFGMQGLSFFANLAAIYILVEIAGMWYMASQLIILGVLASINFVISKFLIFSSR